MTTSLPWVYFSNQIVGNPHSQATIEMVAFNPDPESWEDYQFEDDETKAKSFTLSLQPGECRRAKIHSDWTHVAIAFWGTKKKKQFIVMFPDDFNDVNRRPFVRFTLNATNITKTYDDRNFEIAGTEWREDAK